MLLLLSSSADQVPSLKQDAIQMVNSMNMRDHQRPTAAHHHI